MAGSGCGFCHLEHGRRITLDKDSRAVLERLHPRVRLLVLGDVLLTKVADMGLGQGVVDAMEAWSREFGVRGGEWESLDARVRADVRPSRIRRITACLVKMHVEDICGISRRCLQGEPDRARALDGLLASVRAAYGAKI